MNYDIMSGRTASLYSMCDHSESWLSVCVYVRVCVCARVCAHVCVCVCVWYVNVCMVCLKCISFSMCTFAYFSHVCLCVCSWHLQRETQTSIPPIHPSPLTPMKAHLSWDCIVPEPSLVSLQTLDDGGERLCWLLPCQSSLVSYRSIRLPSDSLSRWG